MGIGLGEGLLLLLIAALFLRGEEIGTVARKLGQWMGQAQRMSRSFMDELQREADRSGYKESTREIRGAMKSYKSFKSGAKGRPLDSLMEQLEGPEGAVKDPGGSTSGEETGSGDEEGPDSAPSKS